MSGYTTIHIPRNIIPLRYRQKTGALVSVAGKDKLVPYGELAQFQIDGPAVARIFMDRRVKRIQEYVYPGKNYTVRYVDEVFGQIAVELVEI